MTWCKTSIYYKYGFIVSLEDIEAWYTTALQPRAWALLLGDFHIPLDNPSSSDFLSLNKSCDVTWIPTPPIHRVWSHSCPLFLTPTKLPICNSQKAFSCNSTWGWPAPCSISQGHHIFLHRNPSKVSPTHLSMLVCSTLPTSSAISSPDVNDTTNTISSTLRSSLECLCPLSTRSVRSMKQQVWYHRYAQTVLYLQKPAYPPVPAYLNNLVGARATPRPLPSPHECCLEKLSVPARPLRLFSYLVSSWWGDLVGSIRAGVIHSSFYKLLKIQLF